MPIRGIWQQDKSEFLSHILKTETSVINTISDFNTTFTAFYQISQK